MHDTCYGQIVDSAMRLTAAEGTASFSCTEELDMLDCRGQTLHWCCTIAIQLLLIATVQCVVCTLAATASTWMGRVSDIGLYTVSVNGLPVCASDSANGPLQGPSAYGNGNWRPLHDGHCSRRASWHTGQRQDEGPA